MKKYIFWAVFIFIFGFVYELFSHGVESIAMRYAWLIPLLGGLVLSGLNMASPVSAVTSRLWKYGIETLTLGSLLKGVFEIYGAANTYPTIYMAVGAGLLGAALVSYLTQATQRQREMEARPRRY
jgi:hypothetical protein